jgi:hypothetical protein
LGIRSSGVGQDLGRDACAGDTSRARAEPNSGQGDRSRLSCSAGDKLNGIPTTLQSESSSRQRGRKKTLGPSGARAQLGSSAALPSWMTAWMLSTIKTVMQLRKQKSNIARPSQMSLIKIKRC